MLPWPDLTTAEWERKLRQVRQTRTRESNDCHTPAGSDAGGQFCSSYRAPARGTAVASFEPSGRIAVRPGFFEQSPDVQRWVLGHEVAHSFSTQVLRDPQKFWQLVDGGVLGAPNANGQWWGYGGNTNADEALTDAVTDYFLQPSALPAPLHALIEGLARERGWTSAEFRRLHTRAMKGIIL
jgi:hypothetical protein